MPRLSVGDNKCFVNGSCAKMNKLNKNLLNKVNQQRKKKGKKALDFGNKFANRLITKMATPKVIASFKKTPLGSSISSPLSTSPLPRDGEELKKELSRRGGLQTAGAGQSRTAKKSTVEDEEKGGMDFEIDLDELLGDDDRGRRKESAPAGSRREKGPGLIGDVGISGEEEKAIFKIINETYFYTGFRRIVHGK